MKKVLLFACVEKNIGDDLFIYIITHRYPNVQFTITEDAKYGSLKDIPNLYFSRSLSKWIHINTMQPRNPLKKAYKFVAQYLLHNRLSNYDIGVSIVGNAFKNENYTGKKQSAWIEDRVKLTRLFFLISTNFGPYNDKRWLEDCREIFGSMSDICFRDKKSYALFTNMPNTRYAPDAVLSMGKMESNSKDYIVISLIDCLFTYRPNYVKDVSSVFDDKIVDIVNHFTEKGETVILLDANKEQDRPAADRIFARLNNKNQVRIYDYEGDINSIFNVFSNAKCVVATRLHTIVLSWLYNTPVFPIVYDIKVEGLLDSCKFTKDYILLKDIKYLTPERVEDVFIKYDFILSDELIEESDMQFKKLDEILLD